MKTSYDIKTDLFKLMKIMLNKKVLDCNGELLKTERSEDMSTEDIVISCGTVQNFQNQGVYCNINCYVNDVVKKQQKIADDIRIGRIQRAFVDFFESVPTLGLNLGFRVTISEQNVYKIDAVNQHMVNNVVYYQYSNN